MMRQLFLILFVTFWSYFGLVTTVCFAKPANDNTYVVPSPQQEPTTQPPAKDAVDSEQTGLDSTVAHEPKPYTPLYHLEPRPSVTLALSRGYETSEKDHSGWIGIHAAPWMTATTRWQVGLDIHDKLGWLQLAVHSLPTRNIYRLYWGGGLSLVLNSDRELRPFIEIESYHLFAAGGWEFQLLERQNLRFELSYHQGIETGYAKATLGYTLQF